MVRLVWIGDGTESALSGEARSLLSSGLPLVKEGHHPAFEELARQGFSLLENASGDHIRLLPGDGPRALDPLYQLVDVVNRLLGPGGCPWDQEQTHETLKKHLIEETYEVIEAIEDGSTEHLREELGDLLLQPVMHAQISAYAGGFDTDEVANEIVLKLVRRHPHVFGDASATDSAEVLKNWDQIKQKEMPNVDRSLLSGVPKSMPALLRAHEISKRAARSGFEWTDIESVFEKLDEEQRELREALSVGDRQQIENEMGDLLFTAVNIARWAGVEPEQALRKMLDRFCERFSQMEKTSPKPLRELSAEEWDSLWNEAKANQS